jgi:DNA-binding MarR family transcriptional regulator
MSSMKDTSAMPSVADNVVHLHISKRERRRAEDKYTPAVVALGYTVLPSLLLKAQAKLKLTPVQLNVLLHIVEPWWDADRLPWIAKDTIAQRMRKSPRSVQRAISQLEKAGHVKRIERFYGRKQQTANGYALDGLVQKLVALEPEFKKVKEQNRLRKKKVEAG